MSHKHYLIYNTCPDQATAERIATLLVDESLAACVNIIPGLTSIYQWAGETQREAEVLLLIKSSIDTYPALEKRLCQEHPYELPEIIAVPIVAGHPPYLQWVEKNSRP